MKALLNFFGFGKQAEKKVTRHSYCKAVKAGYNGGNYYKREDGLEFFISVDLLK